MSIYDDPTDETAAHGDALYARVLKERQRADDVLAVLEENARLRLQNARLRAENKEWSDLAAKYDPTTTLRAVFAGYELAKREGVPSSGGDEAAG